MDLEKGSRIVMTKLSKDLPLDQVCIRLRHLIASQIFTENSDRHEFNQDLIWSSMDTIEDTQLAIDAFSSITPTSNKGNEYLRVYGLFQAMYMQQDAINSLAKGLNISPTKIKNNERAQKVRQLRNKYFGHPEHGGYKGVPTTYHGVSRMTVGSNHIRAWTWPDMTTEEINIAKSIKVNEKYIANDLKRLFIEMENKKSVFASTISSALPDDPHAYGFEKIYSWMHGFEPNTNTVAMEGLKSIEYSVLQIENGLKERYESLGSIGNVEGDLKKCTYAIYQLKDLLKKNPNGMNGEVYVEIHIEALQKAYKELLDICREVNEDFSKPSAEL